jgi:phage/conjugal plasmid C-4 type zinc finger TraR family protein
MAVGWSRDGNVQDQIDATVQSAVEQARSRLPGGESATHCEECDEPIPEGRRNALPGVRYCVKCQSDMEKRRKTAAFYQPRGVDDEGAQ